MACIRIVDIAGKSVRLIMPQDRGYGVGKEETRERRIHGVFEILCD
jgi:hypothetical protein